MGTVVTVDLYGESQLDERELVRSIDAARKCCTRLTRCLVHGSRRARCHDFAAASSRCAKFLQ